MRDRLRMKLWVDPAWSRPLRRPQQNILFFKAGHFVEMVPLGLPVYNSPFFCIRSGKISVGLIRNSEWGVFILFLRSKTVHMWFPVASVVDDFCGVGKPSLSAFKRRKNHRKRIHPRHVMDRFWEDQNSRKISEWGKYTSFGIPNTKKMEVDPTK